MAFLKLFCFVISTLILITFWTFLSYAQSSNQKEPFKVKVPIPPVKESDFLNPDIAKKFITQRQILFALESISKDKLNLVPIDLTNTNSGKNATASGYGEVALLRTSVPDHLHPLVEQLSKATKYIETLAILKEHYFNSEKYNLNRNLHRVLFPIPETSTKLITELQLGHNGSHLKDWEIDKEGWEFQIKPSAAKGRYRALLRSHSRFPRISIALTLENRESSVLTTLDSPILETEMIIEREIPYSNHWKHYFLNMNGIFTEISHPGKSHWDFFAYDKSQNLTQCSSFYSGKKLVLGPAPHSCLGCHFSATDKAFTFKPLSFKGTDFTGIHDPRWKEINIKALEEHMLISKTCTQYQTTP